MSEFIVIAIMASLFVLAIFNLILVIRDRREREKMSRDLIIQAERIQMVIDQIRRLK